MLVGFNVRKLWPGSDAWSLSRASGSWFTRWTLDRVAAFQLQPRATVIVGFRAPLRTSIRSVQGTLADLIDPPGGRSGQGLYLRGLCHHENVQNAILTG